MRFTIGDSPRVYEMADVQMVSLLDLIELEREGKDLGLDLSDVELLRMQKELTEITDMDARAAHPDSTLFLGVQIWLSRRKGGDGRISFVDAIDFPFNTMKVLPEPADRKPAAKKAAGPTKSRPASGRGAKPRGAAAAATSPPKA